MNNSITRALLFVITLSTSIMAQSLNAEDQDFERWKESYFENYHLNVFQLDQLQNIQDASEDLLK